MLLPVTPEEQRQNPSSIHDDKKLETITVYNARSKIWQIQMTRKKNLILSVQTQFHALLSQRFAQDKLSGGVLKSRPSK